VKRLKRRLQRWMVRFLELDHIVFLIGDKPDGALNKAMEECPHLDVRAQHSDLACMHCGVHFPMHLLLPLDWDMLEGISKVFRKKHLRCKKGVVSTLVITTHGRGESDEDKKPL